MMPERTADYAELYQPRLTTAWWGADTCLRRPTTTPAHTSCASLHVGAFEQTRIG